MITTNDVVKEITQKIQNSEILQPSWWVEKCLVLIVLVADEQNKLFDLAQEVASAKQLLLEGGESAAHAKVVSEASLGYKEYCRQKAKVERVFELIRIAKLQSRMADSEMHL